METIYVSDSSYTNAADNTEIASSLPNPLNKLNLVKNKNGYKVEVGMNGLTSSNYRVFLEHGVLKIVIGVPKFRKLQSYTASNKYLLIQNSSVIIPDGFNTKINSIRYVNGFLKIRIGKKKEAFKNYAEEARMDN